MNTDINTTHAETFASLLNEKFPADTHHTHYSVDTGRKYHRIVDHLTNGQRMVHAFVDNKGNVYKSAGWKAPAKGIRFMDVRDAAANADRFGSYLYLR